MRIGELLLARQWIDRPTLSRALLEQPRTEQRLCSMLIARKQLDPDDAARALGAGAAPVAAPILVGKHVACVLAIGADAEDASAPAELDRVAAALGTAFTRILLDAKNS